MKHERKTAPEYTPSGWGRGFRTPFPADDLEIARKPHKVLARGPVNSIPSNSRRATEGYPFQEGEGAGRAAPSQLCPYQPLGKWLCPVFEAQS